MNGEHLVRADGLQTIQVMTTPLTFLDIPPPPLLISSVFEVRVCMSALYGGQRRASGVISPQVPFTLSFWDRVSLWDLGLTMWLVRLARPFQGSPCLRLPSTGITRKCYHPWIVYRCWGWKSGPHAYTASILLAELLP